MKVLFYVLNDPDKLNQLLDTLEEAGIKGCTIFNSNGMGRELAKRDGLKSIVGSFKLLLNPELENTKTLMFVLDDKKVQEVIKAIESTVGNLDEPNTGIAFAFPIDFVKGLKL